VKNPFRSSVTNRKDKEQQRLSLDKRAILLYPTMKLKKGSVEPKLTDGPLPFEKAR
jgi:hypothetical protein